MTSETRNVLLIGGPLDNQRMQVSADVNAIDVDDPHGRYEWNPPDARYIFRWVKSRAEGADA